VITTFAYDASNAMSSTASARAAWRSYAHQELIPTTYVYDRAARLTCRGSDTAGWLTRAPAAEFGWELPDATHVGGVGHVGDLIVIAFFLAIYDGTIDHVASDANFDPGAYQMLDEFAIHTALAQLCNQIHGARLSDIAGTLDPLPSAPVDARLTSAHDLARTALAAALSHQRLEGVRAA